MTSLRPCPACHADVAVSARRCPQCGGRLPLRTADRLLVLVLIVAVAGGVLAFVVVRHGNHNSHCADLRARLQVANITGDDVTATHVQDQLDAANCS